MGYYSRCCEKLEEGFRRDEGFARDISTARWLHDNFDVPFLHILSSLDKALIEKPMFANLSSGTALQQDSVIRKVGRKHFMMNILAAVHFAYIFSFAVIMSEINPNDHKSICCSPFSAR